MSGSQADFWQGPSGTLPVVNANGNIFEEVQVATAAQTVFNIASFTYTLGTKSIWVFRKTAADAGIGGEMLRRAVDYTETSSSSITLAAGATVGDLLIFIAFGVNQLIAPVVNNGIPQGGTAGAVLTKVDGSDYNVAWTASSAITTLLDSPRQNVASTATVNLIAIQSTTRNINITGVAEIDGFQVTNGQLWVVRFSGILLLKNNASIITNTGADITTAANATCILRATADNTVEVISYSAPNGPLLANSLNSGAFGRRNFFYNAGALNSQRGTVTQVAPSSAYGGVDGWIITVAATTAGFSSLPVAVNTASTGFAIDVAAVTTTGATSIVISQRIEAKNAKKLSGKQITISGKVRHGSGATQTLAVTVVKPTASDNYAGTTVVNTTNVANVATGIDASFTSTVTLAATDADNGLEIQVGYPAVGAQAATTWLFFDLQIEVGANATPFDHHSAAMVDSDSNRYLYCTSYGTPKGSAAGGCSGVAISTTILVFPLKYPVAMRVIPTVQLWQNGTQNQIRNISTGVTQTNTISQLSAHSVHGFGVIVFNTATLVVGAGYDFDLIASAEL